MLSYSMFDFWLYLYIVIGVLSMFLLVAYELIVLGFKTLGKCRNTPVDRNILDQKWFRFMLVTQSIAILGLVSASGVGAIVSMHLEGLDLLEGEDLFIANETNALMIAKTCQIRPYPASDRSIRTGRLYAALVDTGVGIFSVLVAYGEVREVKLTSNVICLICLIIVLLAKVIILILVGFKISCETLKLIVNGSLTASSIAPALHRLSAIKKKKNKNNKEGAEGIGGGSSDGVTINVRSSDGSKFSVPVSLRSSVASLKSVIAEKCEVPAVQQQLVYKRSILKDDQTLQSYGMEGHIVHLSSVASTTTTGGITQAVNTNSAMPGDSACTVGGTLGESGLGASLFPGSGLFGAGSSELELMQQQFAENPDMFGDIIVKILMNNPEIMRTMVMNNPQVREIVDRNPELAHGLNDPTTLRQTKEVARNLELMPEMMRNTDREITEN